MCAHGLPKTAPNLAEMSYATLLLYSAAVSGCLIPEIVITFKFAIRTSC